MAEPVYKVVITPRAEASLEKILDYLAEEVSLQTALKLAIFLRHKDTKTQSAINQ